MRIDGRTNDQLRSIEIQPDVLRYAEGSALIKMGHTHVICSASVDTSIPKWLQGSGQGWVTAEYSMLPRSTHTRITREKATQSGRSQEISRLIGRALRAAVDMKGIGERQIHVDCDVIQADGGTRTASITGGFVALSLCLHLLKRRGDIQQVPMLGYVSAVSVGLASGEALLDLNYEEDSSVLTDANFVFKDNSQLVEIQATAEKASFSRMEFDSMLSTAEKGCRELFAHQRRVIEAFYPS